MTSKFNAWDVVQESMFRMSPSDPLDEDLVIWRYLTATKFYDLVITRQLHFSRADQLDDKYEGLGKAEHVLSSQAFNESFAAAPDDQKEILLKYATEAVALTRKTPFINSWCLGDSEDYLMWVAYTEANPGFAIRSTVGRLRKCLPPKMDPFEIREVDYDSKEPTFNLMDFALRKRKVFKSENEIRVVTWRPWGGGDILTENPEYEPIEPAEARRWSVDIGQLVERIVLKPLTPVWQGRVWQEVLDRVAPGMPKLQTSELDAPPTE